MVRLKRDRSVEDRLDEVATRLETVTDALERRLAALRAEREQSGADPEGDPDA